MPRGADTGSPAHGMQQAYREPRKTSSSSPSRDGRETLPASRSRGNRESSATQARSGKGDGGSAKPDNDDAKPDDDGAAQPHAEEEEIKVKVEDLDLADTRSEAGADSDSSDDEIVFLGVLIAGEAGVYMVEDSPPPERYPDPDEPTPPPQPPRRDLPRPALPAPLPRPRAPLLHLPPRLSPPHHLHDEDFVQPPEQNEDSDGGDGDDEGDGEGEGEGEGDGDGDDDGRSRWLWSHPPTDDEAAQPSPVGLGRARERNRRIFSDEPEPTELEPDPESDEEDLKTRLERAVAQRINARYGRHRGRHRTQRSDDDDDDDDDDEGPRSRHGGGKGRRGTSSSPDHQQRTPSAAPDYEHSPSPFAERRRRRSHSDDDDDDDGRPRLRRRPSDERGEEGRRGEGGRLGADGGGGGGPGRGGRGKDDDDDPRRRPGRGARHVPDDLRIGLPGLYPIRPREPVAGSGGRGPGSVVMSVTARCRLISLLVGNVEGRALDPRWHLRQLYPELSEAQLLESCEMQPDEIDVLLAEIEHIMRTLPERYYHRQAYRPLRLDLDTCRRLLKRLFGMYGPTKRHPIGHLQRLYPELICWPAVAAHIGIMDGMGGQRVRYVATALRWHLPNLVGRGLQLQNPMSLYPEDDIAL